METSFHPSLTLVPSLANYSFSLYTPPSLESPSFTTPFPSFHFLAVQRELLSLYRCFCAFARFPSGLQFTGFTYDSSLLNCVIVTYLYMHILYFPET